MKKAISIASLLLWCAIASAQASSARKSLAPADSVEMSTDSIGVEKAQSVRDQKPTKITVVKREFKYGQQIGLALGMMAFIALMMVSAQSWNPD